MKNLLLFYILLCLPYNAIAQDYFIKTIDIENTSSDNGLRIIANENDYVVLCGVITNIGASGIIKSDIQGNKIWDNHFDFYPYESGISNLIKLSNENYLISGARVESGLDFQDLFTFVNDNGYIYRSVVHGDTMDNRVPNTILRGDKIVAFTSITPVNAGLDQYNNTLLLTMDTAGNILREDTLQNIAGYPMNGGEEIILLPTNEYILGIGAQNEPNEIYGYLRKTDTIGTTIWEKRINDYKSITAPIHLSTLQNGNFVVSWGQYAGINQAYGTFVRCYNSAGDSLWQYTFAAFPYGKNIQDLHVCANGDIIGCGYTGNFDLTGASTAWLFRLSPEGSLRWWREYVYWDALSYFMPLYALTEDYNGDIVATGYANRPDDNGISTGQVALLKVNASGCFGSDGCNDSRIVHSVVTSTSPPTPPPLFNAEAVVRVYCASGTGEVFVFYHLPPPPAHFLLYDLNSRKVLEHKLPLNDVFSPIALPNLPSGLYIYVVEQASNVVARGKIIVNYSNN